MSSQQAVAFLSFGIIITGSGPTTAPSPYDVRYGVDNGDGDLGTLTSPAQGDVRQGVQYGGDGDQYTGTLYVAGAGLPTWTNDMLELWHDEWNEWQTYMTYQSWTFQCIRNPIKSDFQMTLTSYNEQADTIIDILRTDAVTSGLYGFKQDNPQSKRPIVKSDGMSFQVMRMENDDTAQPSVRFFCLKLQSVG